MLLEAAESGSMAASSRREGGRSILGNCAERREGSGEMKWSGSAAWLVRGTAAAARDFCASREESLDCSVDVSEEVTVEDAGARRRRRGG